MAHEAKQALDAIFNQLEGALSVALYRNRSRPADETPSVSMRMGADVETEYSTGSFELRRLTVYFDLYIITASDSDLDSQLIELRESIEVALPQNSPIADSPVQYFESIEQGEPQFNSEADTSAATVTLTYSVIYQKAI